MDTSHTAAGAGTISALAITEEIERLLRGPVDGGVPGLVRRIRRILDVSQRGLAALIDVSQSVVARWETGRTSPRASVLEELLRLAGLSATVHDEDGDEVIAMRDDGARTHAGSRFPAHTDLRVTGWWVPAGLDMTMTAYYTARDRSRRRREPMVRYRTCPHLRRVEREIRGTPVDHPSLPQLVAEAEHLDELREGHLPRHGVARSWGSTSLIA